MTNPFYALLLLLLRLAKSAASAFHRTFHTQVKSIVNSEFRKGGIGLEGENDWDIKVKSPDFYTRLAADPRLGLGEGFMEGLWDCPDLPELSYRCFVGGLYRNSMSWIHRLSNYLLHSLFNLQTRDRSFEVGLKHYDMGELSLRYLRSVTGYCRKILGVLMFEH
jgi:cyclopropane-fatty-acyl-phospholipid synthase